MSGPDGPLGFGPDDAETPPVTAPADAFPDDPAGLRGTARSRVPLGIALLAAALLLVWVAINTARNSGVPTSVACTRPPGVTNVTSGQTATPYRFASTLSRS